MHATEDPQPTSNGPTADKAPERLTSEASDAVRRVQPLRISTTGAPPLRDPHDVVIEEPITIMFEDVGSFVLMCTPCDVETLAVGFAFSERLISSTDDIVDLSYRREQRLIGIRLDDPTQAGSGRNLIVTSSCGLCGSRNIDQLMSGQLASRDSLRVPGSLLVDVADQMHARQRLFARTGATHAAAIFTAEPEVLAFGEDIGRHNALDKAIGQCLLQDLALASRGVMLSGRVSLELVAKAANAGIEIVAAVSAPSSLAIDVAQRCNITLCSFVRGDRVTVYTHPHRIEELTE
jgi:FdhD protein